MGACQVRQPEWRMKCLSCCPNGSNPADQHFNRVRSAACQDQCTALVYDSVCLPELGTFFFGQDDLLLGGCGCRDTVTRYDMKYRNVGQSIHQRGSLADLSCHLERVFGLPERGVRISNQAMRPPPID